MALHVRLDAAPAPAQRKRGPYMRCVCAWCGSRLASPGRVGIAERFVALTRPVSHGLCAPCKARLERDCARIH